jgi:hypothetical protein
MEGAEALVGGAGLAELDGLTDELDEIELLLDLGGGADGRGDDLLVGDGAGSQARREA